MSILEQQEKLFILDCMRAFINGNTFSPDKISFSNLNWDRMIQLARAGRVLPFLIHMCEKEGFLIHLPKKYQTWFQSFLMYSEWENHKRITEFKKVKDLFAKNRISFIPLKGIALSHLVYQKTPFRYMADMDLLIRESDLERTRNLLFNDGYVMSEPKNRWQAKAMMDIIGRADFVKAHINVDLQWSPKFFVEGKFVSWDYEGAWQRAEPFRQLGENTFMLSAADQVLYLALQILNDMEINVVHMIQLLDLTLIMQKYQVRLSHLSEQIAALGPSMEKRLSGFFIMVEKHFFEHKIYEKSSIESIRFFEPFFESLLSPKPNFTFKEILHSIQSLRERFLFVAGYFVPSRAILQKKAPLNFLGTILCYFDHWRKQCFSLFKLLLRQ